MPPTTDTRYPHLRLVHEEPNPERRKKPPPGPPRPDRGGRAEFGAFFSMQIGQLEDQAKEQPRPVPGVHPHLVFRVPVADKAPTKEIIKLLNDVGVDVVSVEPDKAIIAFRDDESLAKFQQAIQEYQQPRINPKTKQPYKSTKWDILEFIEADQMVLYSREDRIGSRLAVEIGNDGEGIIRDRIYTLDVEMWHGGNATKARESLEEVRILVEQSDDRAVTQERVWDTFLGSSLCIARIEVSGAKLNRLLDMGGVAEVNLPPIVAFNEVAAAEATPKHFPPVAPPPEDGPRVCVVDSGITAGRPLLRAHVGHEEAILTQTETVADLCGHGTKVGGLAVFGSVRGCYESGLFASPVTLFSARILNDQGRFDDKLLFASQIRRAVETFVRPPHNCKVFNISVGTDESADTGGGKYQAQWATVLDEVARELGVLFVVSAGNNVTIFTLNDTQKAERIRNDYPCYMFEPEARLNDPATSAIAITVGALAEHDGVTPDRSGVRNDIRLPVASVQEPSPLSRIGPGVQGAIKPDFVDYGGNVVFEGFGGRRTIPTRPNPGNAVMSLSHQPQTSLFSYDMGTSFAAPRVARVAALLWHRLRTVRNEEPHANLVRAVLATAAEVPEPARHVIERFKGEQGVMDVCGYGLISESDALTSRDNRVTLCTQDSIGLDTFKIYEVPIPAEFRNAHGLKTITVTLAFDPPVRRMQKDSYLGVTMHACLVRGKSPEEIAAAYRAVPESERKNAPRAISGRFRCDLKPGSTKLDSSTLQRSVWRFRSSNDEYGDSYYLVVWAMRKWAPPEITQQNLAAAVTLEAKHEPRLYNLVRLRVQQRLRARIRI